MGTMNQVNSRSGGLGGGVSSDGGIEGATDEDDVSQGKQARQFSEATQCTGVVLTKLDGSAKGGIALAIALDEASGGLGLPIKLVGLGEQAEDLIDFDPDAFVDALFDV